MLPSPAFSYRANTSAPFAGAISRRGLPARVAPRGGTGEADGCYRHKPLGLQRHTKRGSPKRLSHHATRGGTFTPRRSHLLPSEVFPVPLEAAPQVSRAAPGPRVWPGPWVPRCLAAGARSWAQPEQTEPPAPLPSGTCTRRVTAALALRGSRWCHATTVCSPTFSSVGGEPKLLPS